MASKLTVNKKVLVGKVWLMENKCFQDYYTLLYQGHNFSMNYTVKISSSETF